MRARAMPGLTPSLDLRERFFVAQVRDTAIDTTRFTPAEADSIAEWRWMTPEEIAALPDIVAPRRLAQLLPPILRGDYPSPAHRRWNLSENALSERASQAAA